MLTRDSIRDGIIQRMLGDTALAAMMLSGEQLAASLQQCVACRPGQGDVWLFGYGSLIWNPAVEFVERRIGRIHGFHRRFCLWTTAGRGTPERPGLTLGLERGGSCTGVAFRLPAATAEAELAIVWRREMAVGSYVPRWVTVQTADGPVSAVTFVINREHPRYTGLLPEDRVVEAIATASGVLGRCAEYLERTVEHLAALGLRDSHLETLRDRVVARAGQPA